MEEQSTQPPIKEPKPIKAKSTPDDIKTSLEAEVFAITGKPLTNGWEKLVICKLQPKGRNSDSGRLLKPVLIATYSKEQFDSAVWNPNRKDKAGNIWPLNNLNAYTGFTAEQDPDNKNDLSKILYYPQA